MTDDNQAGPYASAAGLYIDAGWPGVIPVPAGAKGPPPNGFTGWGGALPSWPDIQAWIDDRPGANVGLRLPPGVLGIDADFYGGKPGRATMAAALARFGALPPSWRSTSRDDGSGILLYRVPPGLAWPGELPGGGVELIHYGHRYAVAWPSIHPEGRAYRWITPEGVTAVSVPRLDQLPWLPEPWLAGLSLGEHGAAVKADLGHRAAEQWLAEHDLAAAGMCYRMAKTLAEATVELASSGSRHETANGASLRIVRLMEQKHTGGAAALGDLGRQFQSAVTTGPGKRTPSEAAAEWSRLLLGATQIVAGQPTWPLPEGDPCSGPVIGNFGPDTLPGVSTVPNSPAALTEAIDATTAAPARGRSSWWPVDLAAVLAGTLIEPEPVILARSDGAHLFYPGFVNGLLGPSESGKTWIALEGVRQAVADGLAVLYVDFEDTASGVVTRLRALGIPDADILARVRYMAPDNALAAMETGDLSEVLATHRPALIVLDGVNAAMTLLGLNLLDNMDATTFYQRVLKPLSDTGATVVYIDHVPKQKNDGSEPTGGIGAQAKRAMTNGCAILVNVVTPFGKGQTGKLKLTVDKDKHGKVRGIAGGGKIVGLAQLASDPSTGQMVITIAADTESVGVDGQFRPSVIMGRICEYLASQTDPAGVNVRDIRAAVGGNATNVQTAIQMLISEGHVKRWAGANRTNWHALAKPWPGQSGGAFWPGLSTPAGHIGPGGSVVPSGSVVVPEPHGTASMASGSRTPLGGRTEPLAAPDGTKKNKASGSEAKSGPRRAGSFWVDQAGRPLGTAAP